MTVVRQLAYTVRACTGVAYGVVGVLVPELGRRLAEMATLYDSAIVCSFVFGLTY
jgi:hypothetical protein